jgi:hypothetical protein
MSPRGNRNGACTAPIPKLTTLPENSSSSAIAQEQLWHKRAVEHQQRLLIIRLLASIDRKLELFLNSQTKQRSKESGICCAVTHPPHNQNPNPKN